MRHAMDGLALTIEGREVLDCARAGDDLPVDDEKPRFVAHSNT